MCLQRLWYIGFFDLAICMGRVFARDDFGLAYEVVSDAEFLVLAGHAAMTLSDAGPAHGARSVLTNWKKADDMKILEKDGSIKLRGYLLDIFPDRILAPM